MVIFCFIYSFFTCRSGPQLQLPKHGSLDLIMISKVLFSISAVFFLGKQILIPLKLPISCLYFVTLPSCLKLILLLIIDVINTTVCIFSRCFQKKWTCHILSASEKMCHGGTRKFCLHHEKKALAG